jgi:hypothetical protein
MRSATNIVTESNSRKRLTVRLTRNGEPDRVLEFHAGADVVRVVGRSPSSDVVLRDAGVLPVHCYFEREQDILWLSAAQGDASIRVNYQRVISRTQLSKRCILEVGEARLQVTVLEEDENSPLHGPFGTEVIDLRTMRVPSDLFDTTPIDAHVAQGQFETTAWRRIDLNAEPVTTMGEPPPNAATTHVDSPMFASLRMDTVPIPRTFVAADPVALDPGTTQRILRDVAIAPRGVEPVHPVRPLSCILIEARNRPVPKPVTPPAMPRVADEAAPTTRIGLRELRRPLGSLQPRSDTAALPSLEAIAPSPIAAPEPVSFAMDPAAFTTIRQPISELLPSAMSAQADKPCGVGFPLQSFVVLRQHFARGLGRDRRLVAALAACAVLSLCALTKQSVRLWREVAASTIVSVAPRRAPVLPASASAPPASSASTRPASILASTSAGDPLVGEAVSHLLLGQHAEAAKAYSALAVRYPAELAYSATAKILNRRLNPACGRGSEPECGKALP